jgi:hypothetical protein
VRGRRLEVWLGGGTGTGDGRRGELALLGSEEQPTIVLRWERDPLCYIAMCYATI